VARFYLRIAWLYREMAAPETPGTTGQDHLQELRLRLGTRQEEWIQWLEEARSLAASLATNTGHPDPAGLLGEIDSRVTRLLADWRALLAGAPVGPEPVREVSGYFEFSSHLEFLKRLRDRWTEVPLCEADAVAFALKYYIQFFEQSRSFPQPELEVQTAYLIGELAYRNGQTQVASGYFNHAIRKGQQLMHEFKKDTNRTNYIRKLVEMSIEQGKRNHAQATVAA
jgi:hypothetical protein